MLDKEDKEKINSRKFLIFRVVFLFFYIIFLVICYIFLLISGVNHFISFLIVFFAFIILIGPILSGKRKSLYSRLFPGKRRKADSEYNKNKENFKTERKISREPIRPVKLSFEYRKPLIQKCDKCGMILPSFAKKCSKCGNIIKD